MTLAETLRVVFIPPHPAGRPFIAAGAVVFVVGLFIAPWLAWLGLAFTLFSLFFFRDPERVAPVRPGNVVAPADGRVVEVGLAVPPPELDLGPLPRPRVAIFLSVLNVHVNRMPVSSVVTKVAYHAGKFLSAGHDKASDVNERNAVALRLPDGRMMAVVQIAGLIARRIICDAREGQAVVTGSRFGMIRFGSRTDVYLPEGVMPLVSVGQTMVGGETVIAELA
jgi:phosphatidylserine decarboxylase